MDIYVCLFHGTLLHGFGTHALGHIVDFVPANWQPKTYSYMPKCSQKHGCGVQESQVCCKKSHSSNPRGSLSRTLKESYLDAQGYN